jgi:ABC-type glycerol-3-phosphate transport system substrate-binding protein
MTPDNVDATHSAPRPGRVFSRRRVLATLAAGGAVALAACGESPAPAKSSGPVTVTFMQNDSNTADRPEGNTRVALLEEFSQTNSQKITVNVNDAQANTSNDKLKALAAAGTPPHLYYIAYYFPAEFYLAGMIIDVDEELKADKEWAKQRADIYPAFLESSQWAGKLIGIPGYTNNQAFIYNLGLIQQAGLANPKQGWTWDDFKEMAQKFIRPGIIPLSMDWGTYVHWLGTAGSHVISKDNKTITFDTPEMLQVSELLLDMLKRGIYQKTPDGKGALFETYKNAKNDTVFEMQGPYRIPVLRQNKAPDFMTIHTPVHPVKKQVFASNGGHNLIVFKDVPPEQRQAAAQVAKWMNAPHAQAQMCIKATSIPVSKSATETKELQDYLKTDAPFKGFVDLAGNGWRWPTLPSYAKISGALGNMVTNIMLEQISPKAGLASAEKEAQTYLDDDVRQMK